MAQSLSLVSILVSDYDDAIEFYVNVLGFELVEDTYQPAQNKRWVVVKPKGAGQFALLLAQASNEQQANVVGNQSGGRVFLFLQTDSFEEDFKTYQSRGVEFVRTPKVEPYGTVAVFKDLYGNLWDLIQYA